MTVRTHRILFLALLGLLVLLPRAARAVGEQNGRIAGYVTEKATKKPIGGLEVSATSPALIGGPRTTTVEDNGHFELVELPPGTYDVEIGFPGVKPVRRRVIVRQGETAPLNVAWSPEIDKVQTYNIVEEAHITRPDSAKTGTVLGANKEARLATARSYQNVLTQVAGVSDPAGRGIPNIKGGNRIQNRYLVDGLDVTDAVTNNFSTQVNFDSIGSVEVITGGFEAQYNALGGIININTATGSDRLHVDASFYINHERFGVGRQFGQQLYQHELPFSDEPGNNAQSYQVNLNVSGPLIKQKLWGSISIQYDFLGSRLPIGPPLNVQHPPRQQSNFFPRLKLTWAPRPKHLITFSANGDPAFVRNREQSNGILPVAEYGQLQGGAFGVVQWDYFISNKISTQVQAGYNFNNLEQRPQGQFLGGINYGPSDPRFSDANYTYDPDRRRHTNNDDGSSWYQGIPISLDRRHTVQLDASLSLRGQAAGSHDAKFGIQTRFAVHSFFRHTPGEGSYTSSGGGAGEAGLCDPDPNSPTYGRNCNRNSLYFEAPDFQNTQFGAGVGVYAQDRWRVNRRFVLLPGFRIDWGYTRNSLGQTVSNLVGFGPRIGFTIDITGDSKTILSGHYGRSNDTFNLLPASRAEPGSVQRRHRWNPTTSRFELEQTIGGAGGYQLDGGRLNPPHADEVAGSLLREIFKNSAAGVTYTYKRISNIWDAVEVNQIWDPSGVRVVGYVNGTAERIFRYARPDGNFRVYHGIDFTLEAKPSQHWDLYAAYTLSWLYGPGAEQVFTVGTNGSAYANPRQYKFFDGYLPEDQRHQFKFQVSYARAGFVFGVSASYATGIPLTKHFFNATDGAFNNKHSPQATDPGAPNNPTAVTSFRLPDTFLMNARVSYDFYSLLNQHVIAIVDLFNIFNIDTPLSIENRDNANFALANRGRQAPFRFQIGIRYNY